MTARNRQTLIAEMRNGARVKFLFFWGHRAQADGSIGPGVLSQWWPVAFEVDRVIYRSAEHWMMAEKARLFGDEETCSKILASRTPAEAKKLGRLVAPFDEATWNAARFEIVTRGSIAKFGQHDDLRAYLLSTNTRVLVEASPLDRVWGIGMDANHADRLHPEHWQGENLLGFALMAARDQLRAEGS
jgi:ribA/ribD-fused uncharacterized protein